MAKLPERVMPFFLCIARAHAVIFTACPGVVLITTIRPLTSADSFHQILMRWTSNVAWLLDQHILKPNNADLCSAYLSGLVEKGIVKLTGSIRKVREGTLVEALNDYFPPAFLALYEPNKGGRCNKPYQSIKRLLRGNYAHPAHHLILIKSVAR